MYFSACEWRVNGQWLHFEADTDVWRTLGFWILEIFSALWTMMFEMRDVLAAVALKGMLSWTWSFLVISFSTLAMLWDGDHCRVMHM